MKPLDTIRMRLRTAGEAIKESPELLIVWSCTAVGAIYVGVEFYRLFTYPITK